MDESNISDNLKSVKEMLLDERKLVTYVSLSKEMCIHVNESKTLLGQVVEHLKKENPDIELSVNYIISGLLDNNRARTTVCNEKELDELKKKLQVIFYQHLYSVSVGPPSLDNVSFMALHKFADFPLCTGLVKSLSCVRRTTDEIGGLKTSSQEKVAIDTKPSISNQRSIKVEKKTNSNNISEIKHVTKIQESKSEPIVKNETISPKKDLANNNSHKSDRKNDSKAQKGIAGFFNKSNSVPAKKPVNGTKQTDVKIKQEKPEIKETSKIKMEEMDVDEDIPPEVIEKPKNQEALKDAKEKKKPLNSIKKNAKVDKKRKRVLHVSDSESDEDKNDPFKQEPEPLLDQDSEDEIPPTPLVNTVKITSGITNPKKKRKIVDKTYTDEDGYILTKKEEVYESCSDNEEESNVKENIQHVNKEKTETPPSEKKTVAKNSKKKVISPPKGKQATLMSFFKKVPQK